MELYALRIHVSMIAIIKYFTIKWCKNNNRYSEVFRIMDFSFRSAVLNQFTLYSFVLNYVLNFLIWSYEKNGILSFKSTISRIVSHVLVMSCFLFPLLCSQDEQILILQCHKGNDRTCNLGVNWRDYISNYSIKCDNN